MSYASIYKMVDKMVGSLDPCRGGDFLEELEEKDLPRQLHKDRAFE